MSPGKLAALLGVAVLSAATGYVLGTLGVGAAAVSLALALVGLIGDVPRSRRQLRIGLLVALTWSQLVVFSLVAFDVLPDRGLLPVKVAGRPAWHWWIAQISLQGVYLAAYVAGRAAARRYRRIVDDLEASTRDAARQDALLEEARADYARAVDIARRGAVAPAGPRELGATPVEEPTQSATAEQASIVTIDERTTPVVDPSGPLPPVEEPGEHTPAWPTWQHAYAEKMKHEELAGFVLSGVGLVVLTLITRERVALIAAWVSILGILLAFGVRRVIQRRDPDAEVYGVWFAVAVLGSGSVYAWGLHSAIVAVGALLLFAGALFRAPRAERRQRPTVLALAMAMHGGLFALIVGGVVPDAGNLPVRVGSPYLAHALLQLTLVAAYLAGDAVDRRFAEAFRLADEARRDVLHGAAMLRETRAEIDEALRRVGGGLFTGTTVSGHAVGRLLGRGGMGEVYEATDAAGVRVALKLLRGDRAGDPASLARFVAEGDVLTRVDSPYVARVRSVGRDAGQLPFLAMTYVDGDSLAALLRERERLPLSAVASLVRDVTRGLHDVHGAGLIHLDVKPSNIMLTEEVEAGSRWCLVDFGVARLLDGAVPGAIVGTSQYMAPEQALGGEVDARSDLYSLCLIIYRALTGRPPFPGTDRVALAEAARRGPPDPRAFIAMSDGLVRFLRIGLAADPADRWPTAMAMRDAFEGALAAQRG
jgi:hypothetical protein